MSGSAGDASTAAMRAYWDAKARENAMFYIHSELDFTDTDAEEFWASGVDNLDRTLALFGLAVRPTDRVVEIGCGIGRITRALAARAAHVTGVDVSAEMVERGRAALADVANVELLLGSGCDLTGIPDASADVAYSFIVFQHIPDAAVTCGYIREIGRVLRPGGWTLFQISDQPAIHRPDAYPTARGVKATVLQALGRQPKGCLAPQWLGSSVPRADLLDALAAGGLVLDGTVGDGTQFCFVHAHKPGT